MWRLAYAAATGLAYAALSQCVASLTALGDSTSATFWPGAGLTLGVLLARPRREWPLYLGAVFLAEVLMDFKLARFRSREAAGSDRAVGRGEQIGSRLGHVSSSRLSR